MVSTPLSESISLCFVYLINCSYPNHIQSVVLLQGAKWFLNRRLPSTFAFVDSSSMTPCNGRKVIFLKESEFSLSLTQTSLILFLLLYLLLDMALLLIISLITEPQSPQDLWVLVGQAGLDCRSLPNPQSLRCLLPCFPSNRYLFRALYVLPKTPCAGN